MEKQNYKNHARYVIGFHVVTFGLILITLVLAVINLIRVIDEPSWLYAGLIPLLIAVSMGLLFFYTRRFPINAQDRVIRAEENFRAYMLTGQSLNPALTMSQIIALRFASDQEFPTLAERAIREGLKPADIKQAVTNWRVDLHRA